MARYFQVLQLFWATAIAAELEYRLNFVLAALSSLGGLAGSIFGLFLFYRTGYQFQSWSWEQALIVLGIFTLLQGFSSTFLAPNLNRIVRHIQQGTLDFVLLKPISSQFWLSAHTVISFLGRSSCCMQAPSSTFHSQVTCLAASLCYLAS